MAWSIVAYCIEKSGLGLRLLILGTVEPWREERSMISLFLPEYFLVAMPMGLILNKGKGGLEKGPIMNLVRSESTESGSDVADWRLWQLWEELGITCKLGWKPCVKSWMR